jgi:hypothetical protein
MKVLFLLLHALLVCAEHLKIKPLVNVGDLVEDQVEWPRRIKRSSPAVWGAPVPNYQNAILGPTVYLYTILFLDLKTVEHYSNNWDVAASEVVKLVRESNKVSFWCSSKTKVFF